MLAIDDDDNNNNTTKIISRHTTPVEFAFISLRSPLTKKQCPGRLKLFFDFIKMEGADVEEQGRVFLVKAKTEEAYWAEDNILLFLDHHKNKEQKGK